MNRNLKSFLFTLTAVLFWSTSATAFKITLQGMNNLQLLFYSSIVSLIVLFFLLFIVSPKRIKDVFKSDNFIKNILLGFTNPFLFYLVIFKAYSLLPAQEAMTLNYTWPIAVTLFSVIFLDTKVNSKIILGTITAFIGVVIIGTRGDLLGLKFINLYGVILAVGSSVVWAAFWILNLKDKRENLIKLFISFFYGTIFISIYVLSSNSINITNPNYLFGAIYIGLFEMSLTFFLWLKGISLSRNKAKTATLVYISPFLSMIFIAIILGEEILVSSFVGLICIISGIVLQHVRFDNGKISFNLG